MDPLVLLVKCTLSMPSAKHSVRLVMVWLSQMSLLCITAVGTVFPYVSEHKNRSGETSWWCQPAKRLHCIFA